MALKGINAYKKGNLKQEIATADPHKLTLMLMQGALDRLAYAKGAIDRKDFEGKANFLSRATAIIINLRDTLNMEAGGEIADNLFALYDFMVERISEAHVKNDTALLDDVIKVLTPIRDAWVQIPQQAKEEAYVMMKQQQEQQAV